MSVHAHAAVQRRALLIGINDYSASRLGAKPKALPAPGRDWPNLAGTLNDVTTLQDMLVLLHGFDRKNIITLTDQNATRAAILDALERLVQQTADGDVVFFYFAGHGSQVRNSLSDEPDKQDESLVPADSRAGAADIRDKELRRIFNRILDRGGRLTIMLDACHSGSGARGLATGAIARGVHADSRDVADRTHYGPKPEERGALVLTASHDLDSAWETREIPTGTMHGAFSWAWIRAMRDATPGEAAEHTYLRAQARLRAETPFQDPVMAGNAEARLTPFLGDSNSKNQERAVIPVERVQNDGSVIVQGGWANGLSIGSELRLADVKSPLRLTITALQGVGRCEARVTSPNHEPLRSGALLEVVGWTAPPGRPLRVWAPRVSASAKEISRIARIIAAEASRRGVRWVADPIDVTPTHLLRRVARGWELLSADGHMELLGSDGPAIAAVSRMPVGSSLFVQFAAPSQLVDGVAIGSGVVAVDAPEEADYLLVGRYAERHLEFAWLRPAVKRSDRKKSGLPLNTSWSVDETGLILRDAMLRLRRIHAWYQLQSPPESRFAYRLEILRTSRKTIVKDEALIGEEDYELLLR
ncbi:MAG TPA: caspase family protein, partial [Thermoanaerobaculia bacterium]|nr:caspase family protein [Thermoanaerobaculia bacterium]